MFGSYPGTVRDRPRLGENPLFSTNANSQFAKSLHQNQNKYLTPTSSEYDNEGLRGAIMVARSGKTSPILSLVTMIERRLSDIVRPMGFDTSSRDSLRLFEGDRSIKGLLLACDGFEDALVAAIDCEEKRLKRKLSRNVRTSEKVNMSIRVALARKFAREVEAGTVRIRANGVAKNGVANYISGVAPLTPHEALG